MAATPRRAVLGALLLVVAGCTATPNPTAPPATPGAPTTASTPSPEPEFPVTLTDDEGTAVTIAVEPRTIVSLTPAITETLFALGAGDRVVGKSEDVANDNKGFPPEAEVVEIVATFAGVDVERIVELEPDLVIAAGAGLSQGPAVEQLRRAEIPVLVSYPTTVDAGLDGMLLIAQAVGESEAGDELVDSIKTRIDDLAAVAASASSKPRVFYEIDITNGIFTPPANSIYGEMFGLAGATPISGDANYSISLEELVAADPEVILLGDGAYGQSAETVAARPGWAGMTAVKDGRIVEIDDIIVTRPGPRIVDGLYALILAIHPELEGQLPAPGSSGAPASSLAWLPAAA